MSARIFEFAHGPRFVVNYFEYNAITANVVFYDENRSFIEGILLTGLYGFDRGGARFSLARVSNYRKSRVGLVSIPAAFWSFLTLPRLEDDPFSLFSLSPSLEIIIAVSVRRRLRSPADGEKRRGLIARRRRRRRGRTIARAD